MAVASVPSTPRRAPPSIGRSFTAPIKSSIPTVPIAEATVHGAETLYAHSAGKILSFNYSIDLGRRHSSVSNGRAEFQEESSGTLPWASATERTVAAGPLQIYRVLGSVAFLNSGTILHPILAKSQCWCVDGVSKFVLRIRPNSYYRIELPCITSEEKMKVEDFKAVLAVLLQYEVTPCPFKRGFTVDLPEPPKTPIQRRPWKPKTRLEHTSEQLTEDLEGFELGKGESSSQQSLVGPNTDDIGVGSLERKRIVEAVPSSNIGAAGHSGYRNDSKAADDAGTPPWNTHDIAYESSVNSETPTRPKIAKTGRAITAPPQLTLRTIPSSQKIDSLEPLPELVNESPSLSSSMDSFHSFHSPISPLAPSPPFPSHDSLSLDTCNPIDFSRPRGHKRDVSEATVTAEASEVWDMASQRSSSNLRGHSLYDALSTPPLMSDAASQDEDHRSEAVTPSPTKEIRRRRIGSKQRTVSPLPSSTNLHLPYSPRSHMSGHHLTTAILQRTCSLLLGPPVQLVALMLRIAARLAKGTFRGTAFGFGEGGQKIPCSWDFSDGSDDSEDFWEEDDYGIPLSRPLSRETKIREMAGSWEID